MFNVALINLILSHGLGPESGPKGFLKGGRTSVGSNPETFSIVEGLSNEKIRPQPGSNSFRATRFSFDREAILVESAKSHKALISGEKLTPKQIGEHLVKIALHRIVNGFSKLRDFAQHVKRLGSYTSKSIAEAWEEAREIFRNVHRNPIDPATGKPLKSVSTHYNLKGRSPEAKAKLVDFKEVMEGVFETDVITRRPIEVELQDLSSYKLHGAYLNKKNKIVIDPNSPEWLTALIHEYAHGLDNKWIWKPSGWVARRSSRWGSQQHGKGHVGIDKWFEAVLASESVKRLEELLKNESLSVTDRKLLKEYLSPEELFGRSLTQFVAKRSASAKLAQQWRLTSRDSFMGKHLHWSDTDFFEIDRAIQELLEGRGFRFKD